MVSTTRNERYSDLPFLEIEGESRSRFEKRRGINGEGGSGVDSIPCDLTNQKKSDRKQKIKCINLRTDLKVESLY